MVQIKMRHDSTKCKINLQHEIQEKSPEINTTSPNTTIGRKGALQTHIITLFGKFSPIQKGNSHVNAS
jgi:hypothetical protein